MGAVVAAIRAAAENGRRRRIRTGGAGGKRIIVENGRAVGVALDDGEVLRASIDRLAPSTQRPPSSTSSGRASSTPASCARSSNIRMKGDAAQAASGARPAAAIRRRRRRRPRRGRLVIAPSPDHVERAFNPVEIWRVLARAGDGDHAAQPADPVARAGRRLRAVGGGAICALRAEGGLGGRQAEIPDAIMAQLEAHAPGIGKMRAAMPSC